MSPNKTNQRLSIMVAAAKVHLTRISSVAATVQSTSTNCFYLNQSAFTIKIRDCVGLQILGCVCRRDPETSLKARAFVNFWIVDRLRKFDTVDDLLTVYLGLFIPRKTWSVQAYKRSAVTISKTLLSTQTSNCSITPNRIVIYL